MSRSTYAPVADYTGNGTLADYTFDFKIGALTELQVIILDDDGLEVERVRGDDVTVLTSVDFDPIKGGGTVHLASPLTDSYRLLIVEANDAPTQPFEFKNKFDFTLDRIEAALDWVVGAVQRAAYLAQNALKVHEDEDPAFNKTFPKGVYGKSQAVPSTNDAGDGWEDPAEWVTVPDLAAAQAAADSASLSAADSAAEAAASAAAAVAAAASVGSAAAEAAAAAAAQLAAEAAQTAAEAAQTAAEAAETNSAANAQNAIDARDSAQGYATTAEAAKDDAQLAAVAAIDAQDAAEAAQLAAEAAETAAEAAETAAEFFSENTTKLATYANDAAYESDIGTGVEGSQYFNTTSNKPRYHNGTAWVDFGTGAGGGGGGGLRWYQPDSLSAEKRVLTNGLEVWDFDNADDQSIFCKFTIPAAFVAATQIFLKNGKAFSALTSGNFLFRVTTYIFKANISGASTPTGHVSTNAQQAVDATTNEIVNVSDIDLTDSAGEINGVPVAAGDLILVKLTRAVSAETSSLAGVARLIDDTLELVTTA